MSKKGNKRQHYVSAFYLYHFTNREQRGLSKGKPNRETKIWHYDKQKNHIKERPIRKIATESYLFSFKNDEGEYDHSLDEKLCEVEVKTAAALDKLGNVVTSLKKGRDNDVKLHDSILEDIITFMVWQMRRHPTLVNYMHQQCKELAFENEFDINPKETALKVIENFGMDDIFNFESTLRGKNKKILFIENSSTGFITIDEPVVRFNEFSTDGIGMKDTEIYFPLTSNLLLLLHGRGKGRELMLKEDPADINTYLATKAKNYIFGSSKESIESLVKNVSLN